MLGTYLVEAGDRGGRSLAALRLGRTALASRPLVTTMAELASAGESAYVRTRMPAYSLKSSMRLANSVLITGSSLKNSR